MNTSPPRRVHIDERLARPTTAAPAAPAIAPNAARTVFGALALAAALGLGGCATVLDGHPQPATDPDDDLLLLKKTIDANAVVDCFAKPTHDCRNSVVGGRMYAADLRFAQFEEQLFKEGRKTAFGSSVAALGLSAAATASTGGTAQVLSGLNTLLLGSREAYQKDLLGERTAAAIHTAMHARRTQVAVRLHAGLGRPLAAYPLPVALSDLTEYVRAGTLVGALTEITSTVGEAAKKAERELAITVGDFAMRDDAAKAIELELCKGQPGCAQPDPATLKRAQACAKQGGLGEAAGTVYTLIDGTSTISAQQRQKVLDCLRSGS